VVRWIKEEERALILVDLVRVLGKGGRERLLLNAVEGRLPVVATEVLMVLEYRDAVFVRRTRAPERVWKTGLPAGAAGTGG
jgi:hypothetical protein